MMLKCQHPLKTGTLFKATIYFYADLAAFVRFYDNICIRTIDQNYRVAARACDVLESLNILPKDEGKFCWEPCAEMTPEDVAEMDSLINAMAILEA